MTFAEAYRTVSVRSFVTRMCTYPGPQFKNVEDCMDHRADPPRYLARFRVVAGFESPDTCPVSFDPSGRIEGISYYLAR